jgi:hypothetical protein
VESLHEPLLDADLVRPELGGGRPLLVLRQAGRSLCAHTKRRELPLHTNTQRVTLPNELRTCGGRTCSLDPQGSDEDRNDPGTGAQRPTIVASARVWLAGA